jgi:hypothetical protein
LYIVHPIFSLVTEIILYHLEDNEIPYKHSKGIINIVHAIFLIFYMFWFIVGNVLYFVANDDFSEGYDLTLGLVVLHYIVSGVVYVAF